MSNYEYDGETGQIKYYIRNRPVVVYTTSDDSADYDVEGKSEPPEAKLQLEWVYGYRGDDARNNLYVLRDSRELCYFIAATAVIYNTSENTQRHYTEHSDDITCMDVHGSESVVATGQVKAHDRGDEDTVYTPHVRIWDHTTLETQHVIGAGVFKRAVTELTFSKTGGGDLLCVIDELTEHNISVWKWREETCIVNTKCCNYPVLGLGFNPVDDSSIVSCGKSHVYFWDLDLDEGELKKKTGVIDDDVEPKAFTCLTFHPAGDALLGGSNGHIFVFPNGEKSPSRVIQGHEDAIFDLNVLGDWRLLSGGGRDGTIKHWTAPEYETTDPEQTTQVPGEYGCVRCCAYDEAGTLYIGTTSNYIVKVGVSQEEVESSVEVVTAGHEEELWGLDTHPANKQFVTGSRGGKVALWDIESRTCLWTKDLKVGIESVCISPGGHVVVAGAVDGQWFVVEVESTDVVGKFTTGDEAVRCCRFSPDGSKVVLGNRDNHLYVYSAGDDYTHFEPIGKCQGHSSFVRAVDWSEDGTYLRSSSGDYELLYWNAETCDHVTDTMDLRDVAWHSDSTLLGYNAIGIWPEGADGTDINTSNTSTSNTLMATGDDYGKLKLFQYPVNKPRSEFGEYGGHSSHVTNVMFTQDDAHVISVGGKDCAVMQWAVTT